MAEFKQNTKVMAKNSAFMYINMAIRMLVGLYTTRVILQALGAQDFGIYNVVFGFVSMFGFISATMASASMRFFAYEIGRDDLKKVNEYFNLTILCYILLIVTLFVVFESIGPWFINNKLVIPDERLYAANVVFQIALFSFSIHIFQVPFTSMTVAKEKMVTYAIVGMLDAFLKLGIVFALLYCPSDKLILYAIMLAFIELCNLLFYFFFCRVNFRLETKISIFFNRGMFREIVSYSGWSLFWTLSNVARSQGINIVLNMFFTPVVNAARGVAYQINSAVTQFVTSFYNAVRPQITKLSAQQKLDSMKNLVYSSSIISFCLIMLIAVPVLVKAPYILSLWLKDVPEYTVIFTRLVIVVAMIDTLGHPLTTAVCSTGKIKWFHLITGTLLILTLPIGYLLLSLGMEANVVFIVSIIMSICAQISRMVFVHRMFGFTIKEYSARVLLRLGVIFLLSYSITEVTARILPEIFLALIVVCIVSWLSSIIPCYYIGLSEGEREMTRQYVVNLFRKMNKKDKHEKYV